MRRRLHFGGVLHVLCRGTIMMRCYLFMYSLRYHAISMWEQLGADHHGFPWASMGIGFIL